MTCAEARRQLSAPDATLAADIVAHLEDCAPCRGESESLKEVDRRLVRLGEVRRGVARAVYSRDPGLGRVMQPASSPVAPALMRKAPQELAASRAESSSGSHKRSPIAPAAPSASLSRAGRASIIFFALSVVIVLPAFLWLLFRIRRQAL